MISPARSAISWAAPDAPLCDAPPRSLECAVPDDVTQVADWLQQRAAHEA
jgi:hypothetical protein